MKLDEGFTREIKKTANGDGSREAKFAFLWLAKAAARALSTPSVMTTFGDATRAYGRVAVGVCVAATVLEHSNRLKPSTVEWARSVMQLWSNRPSDPACVAIRDGLHPTRIEEYAGSLIRLTTDES